MAKASLDLIEAMYGIAEECHPITGRGVGYKLFAMGLIESMKTGPMQKVYRLLKIAREQGAIPWHWIVDETRELERTPSWDDPEEFARAVIKQCRRDFWTNQPKRVEVWSEKGTVRGVLAPVLAKYGVGFRVMHGFGSATSVYDVAQDYDGRPLIILYVGDYDPSGMGMSEDDLLKRFEKYDGDHVHVVRIALLDHQTSGLGSFSAHEKQKDPHYKSFLKNYGETCWELDAMDPNDLREIVEEEIESLIEDTDAWKRCEAVVEAERQSLSEVLNSWRAAK